MQDYRQRTREGQRLGEESDPVGAGTGLDPDDFAHRRCDIAAEVGVVVAEGLD